MYIFICHEIVTITNQEFMNKISTEYAYEIDLDKCNIMSLFERLGKAAGNNN